MYSYWYKTRAESRNGLETQTICIVETLTSKIEGSLYLHAEVLHRLSLMFFIATKQILFMRIMPSNMPS